MRNGFILMIHQVGLSAAPARNIGVPSGPIYCPQGYFYLAQNQLVNALARCWLTTCTTACKRRERSLSRVDQEEIVRDILRYLDGHPGAADTLDHITRWWLPAKSAGLREVRGALRRLVKRGILEQVDLPGGERLYKAHPVQAQSNAAIADRGQAGKEDDLDGT
jgi:hypothetical protein